MRIGSSSWKGWRAVGSDRRGAASFELVLIYPILLLGIMLPLADLAAAGYRYISARQALHAFGQYLMYAPPDDLADTSGWFASVQTKADALDFTITNLEVMCGEAACSGANLAKPKYYTFDTTVTLTPIVLTSVLCPSSCTYTISYSARFQ